MVDLAVVADDLSGAAESGATGLLRTSRTIVVLDATTSTDPHQRVVTVDTDSRALGADDAGRRAASAGAAVRDATLVVKKVDSLLRGPLGAELDALAAALDAPAVVATALPAHGRTVVDGATLVDGLSLRDSGSWAAETGEPPRGIADLLATGRAATVGLDVVRAAPSVLTAALRRLVKAGRVPVCDGLTTDDLRAVREAALDAWARPLLVGSGALVGVVAELLGPDDPTGPGAGPDRPGDGDESRSAATAFGDGRLLMVLGSASSSAHRQLAHLEAALGGDIHVVRLRPRDLLDDADAVRERLTTPTDHRVQVVAVDADDVVPGDAALLTAALGHVTSTLVSAATSVVLTGGATARRVLDDRGVRTLQPLRVLSGGAVLSRADTGQLVVTRPGSHGDDASLTLLVRELTRPTRRTDTRHTDTRSDPPLDTPVDTPVDTPSDNPFDTEEPS